MIPDEHIEPGPEENSSDDDSNLLGSENPDHPKRRKMRVKIRKKIRIKQKPSPKKLVRKIAERAFWIIIIIGFVASLIIMIVELDVRDERFKNQKRKAVPIKGQ